MNNQDILDLARIRFLDAVKTGDPETDTYRTQYNLASDRLRQERIGTLVKQKEDCMDYRN